MTAPGPTAGAGHAGAAKGHLAGFEALMAAFFGAQGEGQPADPAAQLLGAQPAAQAGDAAMAAAAVAGADGKTGKPGKPGEGDSKAGDTPKTDAAAATDANLALIAALAGQPAPGATADAGKAKGEAAEGGKGTATPGGPTLPQAQAGADLFQKAVAAGDTAQPDAKTATQTAAQTAAAAAQTPDAAKTLARAAQPAAQAPAPAAASAKPAAAVETPAPQPAVQAAAEAVTAPPAQTAQAVAAATEAPVAPAPAKEKAAPRNETDGKPAARTEAFAAAPAHQGPHAVPGPGANRADGRNDNAAANNAAANNAAAHAAEAATVETEAAPAHEPAQPAAQAPQAEASVAAPAPMHPQAPAVRGSPETVANLAAQILKKLDGRSTRFNVELTPAGLGRVDVSVEINAHGRVSTAMAFDSPQAAADVKARSADLQQALEQAGFDMSGGMSFDVAGQQNRQGQGFAGTDGGQGERSFRGRAFQQALDTAGEADSQAGGLNLRRGLRSAVDVRI
jgi:hypothetical protein